MAAKIPRRSPAASSAARPPAARASAAKAVSTASPASAPVAAPVVEKQKSGKHKLVRDSFTMPPDDYALIAQIKLRALKLEHAIKKSELLRAGLKVLAAMDDRALRAALRAVPALKTGRPKKDKYAEVEHQRVDSKTNSKKAGGGSGDAKPGKGKGKRSHKAEDRAS